MVLDEVGHLGIIPAYAGSTRCGRTAWSTSWDHPRICGEHGLAVTGRDLGEGSSPHMRGALVGPAVSAHRYGIIPAYAGSTARRARKCGPRRDHPRICGEHMIVVTTVVVTWGSSPHMRGAPLRPLGRLSGGGIIPAYAGSTRPCPRHSLGCRDHPRICGEHNPLAGDAYLTAGSSPHMRGAPMA